mmetsp:Transcript_13422/g.35209  ORF Transcript_13422/g.35209 Transcript_13422/m.35209 type:complete len:264 (+) Transcript_13422:315-1106(+)
MAHATAAADMAHATVARGHNCSPTTANAAASLAALLIQASLELLQLLLEQPLRLLEAAQHRALGRNLCDGSHVVCLPSRAYPRNRLGRRRGCRRYECICIGLVALRTCAVWHRAASLRSTERRGRLASIEEYCPTGGGGSGIGDHSRSHGRLSERRRTANADTCREESRRHRGRVHCGRHGSVDPRWSSSRDNARRRFERREPRLEPPQLLRQLHLAQLQRSRRRWVGRGRWAGCRWRPIHRRRPFDDSAPRIRRGGATVGGR